MNRLKQSRKAKGYTQKNIAEVLSVTPATYSRYESGDIKPDPDTLKKLSSVLGVSVDYLIGASDTANTPDEHGAKIPVLGRVVAGIPIEAVTDIIDYEEIPEALAKTGEFFALKVQGDSMSPRICDGDVVIVRKQEEVENGEIAAVRIGDEATLKRVYFHDDYIELRPENPAYSSIIRRREEMDDVSIEGRAVGFCRGL